MSSVLSSAGHVSLIGGRVERVRARSPGTEKHRWLGEPRSVITSGLAFQSLDLPDAATALTPAGGTRQTLCEPTKSPSPLFCSRRLKTPELPLAASEIEIESSCSIGPTAHAR